MQFVKNQLLYKINANGMLLTQSRYVLYQKIDFFFCYTMLITRVNGQIINYFIFFFNNTPLYMLYNMNTNYIFSLRPVDDYVSSM